MRVAYIHTGDLNDKKIWSGIQYFIYQNLKKRFDNVLVFKPVTRNIWIFNLFFKGLSYFLQFLKGKQCLNLNDSYFLPKSLSRSVDRFIAENPVDCIISTTITPFIFTKNKTPLIIIADATVNLLYKEYANGKGWSKLFLKHLEKNSLKVTNKSTLIISSSSATTNSLITDYKISNSKIATIPFGANIDDNIINPIDRQIDKNQTVIFLFVGKEWERKGGDFAVSVCDELIKKKYDIKLTIVGCKVPEKSQRSYLKNFVNMDKNREDEFNELKELYRKTHFFMVFSRAEMYGIVFCEAAAFGLPSVAFAVGGIVDIVINDKTGIILPKGSNAEDFALKISELISDPIKYKEMSVNARKRYDELLNWDVFTASLKNEISKRLN